MDIIDIDIKIRQLEKVIINSAKEVGGLKKKLAVLNKERHTAFTEDWDYYNGVPILPITLPVK